MQIDFKSKCTILKFVEETISILPFLLNKCGAHVICLKIQIINRKLSFLQDLSSQDSQVDMDVVSSQSLEV